MDKIRIENLEIFARHGVYEEENKLGQLFVISVDLYSDIRLAASEDDINQAVNYGEVCHFIKGLMEEHTFKLIESAAGFIADQLLLKYSLLRQVTVEVKKPNAPILLHVKYVSVTVTRSWHKVYLAVGSNQGDSQVIINSALKDLEADGDIRLLAVSDLIVTKPYGDIVQDDFLNGCLSIETIKDPHSLLYFLNDIEKAYGRTRDVRWGPRTLDLDILLYDDLILDSKELTIPHADMANRAFVLEPLMQIAAYVRHPVFLQTIGTLYTQLINRETDK